MEPIQITLTPTNKYGYHTMMAECPECSEEIEDVMGLVKCECGQMLDCRVDYGSVKNGN